MKGGFIKVGNSPSKGVKNKPSIKCSSFNSTQLAKFVT